MTGLLDRVEPEDVGLHGGRLARLDHYLRARVDSGRMPGYLVAVARRGRLAHLGRYGARDLERRLPVEVDTVFRIYSMTKPITSVAAMMLSEEGCFGLDDAVGDHLPAFREQRVYVGGNDAGPVSVPAPGPVRIRHLMTHTSGLTYGFHRVHPVDARYRAAGFGLGLPPDTTLAQACDVLAAQPLLFAPGTEWNYSLGTDVLGRLVEVVSGQSLPDFLAERILGPLAMRDTGFQVPADHLDRLARLYVAGPDGPVPDDTLGAQVHAPPSAPSGGGGLVSTVADYLRFAEMLRRGGELDGVRLLGPRTVAHMTANHLPGGADLAAFGRPLYAETPFHGVGFGLGVAVVLDPVRYGAPTSVGEFGWGGAASTVFWADPREDLTVVLLTQLMPPPALPIRPTLRQLVHQAIVD
ncbi:serine hydrolase [Actinomycetospora sp. NBRC 106375]|uniref:serine hydrolase domain-containing protein n=1 Tax=Actinomycetospora sp. NBRC 106375 TaxID=3032207 RepID=UPI0024A4044B|nr:serine hydrolase domain-containing protein [Actinomycetospora sp. NBRC 106375]GLZ49320.1 serine hydrolase [Actinomycetospora sp. NBRC 106375]